jgi:hypothetical protein
VEEHISKEEIPSEESVIFFRVRFRFVGTRNKVKEGNS